MEDKELAQKMANAMLEMASAANKLTLAVDRLERRMAVHEARDTRIAEVLERLESKLTERYQEAV